MPDEIVTVVPEPTPEYKRVLLMTNLAIDALGSVPETTTGEVYCAAFTVTQQCLRQAVEKGADLQPLRDIIQGFWELIPKETVN